MRSKHGYNKKNGTGMRLLKVFLFLLMCYGSIKLGTVGGSILYSADASIVEKVDVDTFKMTLNNAFPLIDTIYNSGNTGLSVTGEVKGILNAVFGFDLSKPLTILNSQSPILLAYYNKSYLPLISSRDQAGREPARSSRGDIPPYRPEAEAVQPQESSISYEHSEPGTPSGNDVVSNGKVSIQNETKVNITQTEIDEMLAAPLKFKFDKKGPKVLIYHTHTSESYIQNSKDIGRKDIPSSSSDPRYNIVRVGEELAQTLRKKYGIDVIHNGTVHDGDYNSSYVKSLNTASAILKSYPSIRVMLDIHRDGMGENEPKLRAVTNMDGRNTAKIMFVVGTDQIGLSHPNWKENLKFAVKLQEKLMEQGPDLVKPILISKNRYNEHLTTGSLIIEIGGDGNTLEEALESTKYLGKAINDVANGK